MPELKSEQHHWWPKGVSAYWADAKGGVHRLLPNGEVKRIRPQSLGMIGNGHHIKYGARDGVSFEDEFDRADTHFPFVIEWLDGLDREERSDGCDHAARFSPITAPEEKLSHLLEGLVSLAVRSPMNRQMAVALAEDFRGQLPEPERNALIGLNMRDTQRRVMQALGTRGKFVVIYSPHRELIFGDGFFHNIRSPSNATLISPKILAPITPRIAVLYAKPMSYRPIPRLMTFVATAAEAEIFNHAVQVHARDMVFYQTEAPKIVEAFTIGNHQVYGHPDNPIDAFIHRVPGIPARDASLDFLNDPRWRTLLEDEAESNGVGLIRKGIRRLGSLVRSALERPGA